MIMMNIMTKMMTVILIRLKIIISKKKNVKKVILSRWILLIWIKMKAGIAFDIPAYSLQRVTDLLQYTEKGKIIFAKKDWRI